MADTASNHRQQFAGPKNPYQHGRQQQPESYQQRRRNKPLTKGEINALKPRAETYRVADGEGVYLQIEPNGSMLWRMEQRGGAVATEAQEMKLRGAVQDSRFFGICGSPAQLAGGHNNS